MSKKISYPSFSGISPSKDKPYKVTMPDEGMPNKTRFSMPSGMTPPNFDEIEPKIDTTNPFA